MKNHLLNEKSVHSTPQTERIPGSTQEQNNAGGFGWKVDDATQLLRFLVLGTEGGTYYVGEKNLTRKNTDALERLLKNDPLNTVKTIVEVSESGRAPNNDYALYALAMACSPAFNDNIVARTYALESLPKVARTGTHLFHFAQFAEQFRGWGRGLRNAVGNWYEEKDAKNLSYQVIKYRQRDGWTHADLLRLAHPKGASEDHKAIYDFVSGRESIAANAIKNIAGYQYAQESVSPQRTATLVRDFNLPHEALKTEHKNSFEVITALLESGMPLTAMIRNLATYTRNKALEPGSDNANIVIEALKDQENILKARVHPIQLLSAYNIYSNRYHIEDYGYGYGRNSGRGKGVDNPNAQITDALEEAFYLSFGNVEPTGKRRLIGLDVSGSMSWGEIAGVPGLTPALGAACMAMVSARSGDPYEIMGFAGEFRDLGITAKDSLDSVMRKTGNMTFGTTDCSLPIKWASSHARQFDIFEVYTDSETYAGRPHPSQALKDYRKSLVPDARLAVIGMVGNDFTIADPKDRGMIDVVGFDSSTPQILSDFACGVI